MDSFLNGFADELTKLGRAAFPAEVQSRAQASASVAPAPKAPASPTKPIRQTAPRVTPRMPSTKAPAAKVSRGQPINPYKGRDSRFNIKAVPRTATARDIAQARRPTNMAGPTHKALTAVQPQAIKSWAKPERERPRASPKYQPKAAPPVEVKPKKKRRGKKKTPDSGPSRLRRPGETATAFADRMSGNQSIGRKSDRKRSPNEPWYMSASNPKQRKEILENRKGTYEYRVKQKRLAEAERKRQARLSRIRPNLRGFTLQ